LLKKATFMQRYNATVEGGSGRTRYFVSLGYTGQAGMFNTEKEQNYSTNTEFSRINFRSNVDFDITEALEMPRVFDEKLYKISQDLSR